MKSLIGPTIIIAATLAILAILYYGIERRPSRPEFLIEPSTRSELNHTPICYANILVPRRVIVWAPGADGSCDNAVPIEGVED